MYHLSDLRRTLQGYLTVLSNPVMKRHITSVPWEDHINVLNPWDSQEQNIDPSGLLFLFHGESCICSQLIWHMILSKATRITFKVHITFFNIIVCFFWELNHDLGVANTMFCLSFRNVNNSLSSGLCQSDQAPVKPKLA